MMKQIKALPAAAFIAAALVAAFLIGGEAEAQGPVVVGIDLDTSGNTASSLGERQYCRSVQPGDRFDIDVFLDKIPEGRDLTGYNYILNYDAQRLTVAAADHQLLLIANRDARGVSDLSEETPDTDGEYKGFVFDFSPTGTQPGPLAGVLGRYTIQTSASAAPGVVTLTLAPDYLVTLVDAANEEVPITEIHSAKLAIGQSCTPELSTPDVVVPGPAPGTSDPDGAGTDGQAGDGSASPGTGESPGPNGTPAPGPTGTSGSGSGGGSGGGSGDSGQDDGQDATVGDQEDDGGMPWLAIIISVVTGLTVLSGGGFVVWRRLRR